MTATRYTMALMRHELGSLQSWPSVCRPPVSHEALTPPRVAGVHQGRPYRALPLAISNLKPSQITHNSQHSTAQVTARHSTEQSQPVHPLRWRLAYGHIPFCLAAKQAPSVAATMRHRGCLRYPLGTEGTEPTVPQASAVSTYVHVHTNTYMIHNTQITWCSGAMRWCPRHDGAPAPAPFNHT